MYCANNTLALYISIVYTIDITVNIKNIMRKTKKDVEEIDLMRQAKVREEKKEWESLSKEEKILRAINLTTNKN